MYNCGEYHAAIAISGTGAATPVADVCFDALFIGAAGNVTMKFEGGQSVTLTAVLAGHIYPVRGRWVTACPANTVALFKKTA